MQELTNAKSIYKSITKRKYRFVILLMVLTTVSFIIDLITGAAMLGVGDVFNAIFHPTTVKPITVTIVRTMRLPIAAMAIAVGGALGLAGAVMQTILNNPLASPYTLGVGAGAAFGASLAVVLDIGAFAVGGEYMVSANAFFFAMLACLLIYVLGKIPGIGSNVMVLSGIALLFLFQAMQALLQYTASEGDVQTIVFWTFGSLQKSTPTKLLIVGIIMAVCVPLIIKDSWKYTALLMGDEKAESLGVHVNSLKMKAFLLVSLLAAGAVCFVGTIGFIGLAGPHMARMLVGEDQRYYFPISALCGAFLLSLASILTKIIIPGSIFPIGIITSLIGVPFFFILIFKKRRAN